MGGGGGGKAGHRAEFWHFPKNCCKIPYPRAKMLGQNNWNSPPREMIGGHGHKQKFKYPYPRDSKMQDNSNALPPGQSDRSKSRPIPCLCPLPPGRLDIATSYFMNSAKLSIKKCATENSTFGQLTPHSIKDKSLDDNSGSSCCVDLLEEVGPRLQNHTVHVTIT